jgi:hypothetical protein
MGKFPSPTVSDGCRWSRRPSERVRISRVVVRVKGGCSSKAWASAFPNTLYHLFHTKQKGMKKSRKVSLPGPFVTKSPILKFTRQADSKVTANIIVNGRSTASTGETKGRPFVKEVVHG